MATAQERSLLQQLINGQIDKDTYESEVAKIREPARTPEAVANNPFKYTVSGQGYLTLDAIEQEYRDKLKESASDTGNIDIGVARAAQNTAKAKTDYMLSDEYQDDIEQDRLNKIKKNAEETGGDLSVEVMRGIQNTTKALKDAVTDAQQTIDNRGGETTPTTTTPTTTTTTPTTPTTTTTTPTTPTTTTEVVQEDDSLFGRLGGQIWNVGGQKYIAFDIPRTGLSMAYTATEEQIDNFFTVDKPQEQTIDSNSDKWSKSFQAGNIVEVDVVNMEASGVGGFFEQVASNFDKVKAVRPWMEDDEMYSLWLESVVENRDIADFEWEGTNWWQTHSQEERNWLLLSQGKDLTKLPADAEALLSNNRIKARETLRQNGVTNPDQVTFNGESLTEWFGNKLTTGTWTELQWLNQAKGLGDPMSGIAKEDSLASWLEGSATQPSATQAGVATAQALALEYLGPLYGQYEDVSKYAGMIRNAESEQVGRQMVIDDLKNVRKVLFSTDTYDENLTYEQIAQPWRNFSFQLLGGRVDETSSDWIDVLNANSQEEATKILTTVGLNEGNKNVMDKVTDDIGSFLGVGSQSRGVVRGQGT
tara:strand:+ start:1291 stop:3060 length:1770 start_codon:yes stop_codon:yes gene_type:complete